MHYRQAATNLVPGTTREVTSIPDHLRIKLDLDKALDWLHPDFAANCHDPEWLSARCVLCPFNKDVDEINAALIERMQGNATECLSADATTIDDSKAWPIEFLRSLNPSGMPAHKLSLKTGMPVTLIRNVCNASGDMNGTRHVIKSLHANFLCLRHAQTGREVLMPKMRTCSDPGLHPFVLERCQFSIWPCFAMTINKSQGQSLGWVLGWLPRDPWVAHGQLHVLLSRCGNPDHLRVAFDGNGVRNTVIKKVLTGNI